MEMSVFTLTSTKVVAGVVNATSAATMTPTSGRRKLQNKREIYLFSYSTGVSNTTRRSLRAVGSWGS